MNIIYMVGCICELFYLATRTWNICVSVGVNDVERDRLGSNGLVMTRWLLGGVPRHPLHIAFAKYGHYSHAGVHLRIILGMRTWDICVSVGVNDVGRDRLGSNGLVMTRWLLGGVPRHPLGVAAAGC